MKKTALIIMTITIGSKLLGFIRDIVLSYFYGASNITDAYFISKTIPSFMFMFIGTAIMTGYIPTFTKIEKNQGLQEGNTFNTKLINVLLIICTVIVILVLFFSSQIVKVFASGFTVDTLEYATAFTRINILTIYCTALIYIFTGFLQVRENYFIPALIGVPLNIIVIISIIFSAKTNAVSILAIGYTIAVVCQLLFMLPSVCKNGFKYQKTYSLEDENLKGFALMVIPTIIGVSVNQLNVLVDKTLASRIATGGISALTYANQLNLFVQGIFVISLVTVMYPLISKMVTENNINGLKKTLNETIGCINLLVLPATVGSMILAKPIVTLLFGRGAFDSQAIILTSSAFFFYSIGMIGFGLREVLSRVFYSMQDTKTPMTNAVISLLLNIVLSLTLSPYFGVGGLALATSISAIFTTGLLFISLRRKIGPFGMRKNSISFLKILFASFVMGLFAKLSFDCLTTIVSHNLSIIMGIVIGVISYFVIIYFMRIEEVDVIVSVIKRKLGNAALS